MMKNLRNITILFSAIVLLGLASCKKNDEASLTPNSSQTILNVVAADANFSLLAQAATKSGVADTLGRTPAAYTAFAPDNNAFTTAGITSTSIANDTLNLLRNVLRYHIISGSVVFAATVQTATNAKVIMSNGDSAFFTKKSNGNIFVNGVQVTMADIGCVNGVAHKVGRVIRPATGNIVATANAAKLDSLVIAIGIVNSTSVLNGGDPTLVSTLNSSLLTVFAPTNAAFVQLLTALGVARISQIPVATLTAVLKFHVIAGRNFSSELPASGNITMLAGGAATVNLTNGTGSNAGGPTIKGNGNGTNLCNITATDIMCRNGVVHLIDRVLLP